MNINDIPIGDSRIEWYRIENNALSMRITDYNDISYEIEMNNCGYLFVNGSVGFSMSSGKFNRAGIHDHWFFYDEDGAVMEIKFNGYTIKRIGDY